MVNIYDWDTNKIEFNDKYDNEFNIQLRGQITMITGESASGKTLLYNKIKDIQKDMNRSTQKYSADNIFLLNEDNIEKLAEQQHKLVIIDRADILLTDKEENIINSNVGTRYLIFARRPLKIEVSPNHYATLINNNGKIETHYRFNVRGWC